MQKLIAALLIVLVAILGAMAFQNFRSLAEPKFPTPYQAVVLNGGQVYYGKLENLAALYPVLRDVFYVVRKENLETKQVTNVLVRRGKELHGPEFMVLNRQSILFIEPVRSDSDIGRSITEQNISEQKKNE